MKKPFLEGQKGSSAMPHKKNPIVSDRITGLSRILRSFVIPALRIIILWHERNISHSFVEKFILSDSTSTLHYILVKARWIIDNLRVNERRMRGNIEMTKGLVFFQRVLLKLVEKGMSRDEAYEIVQKKALECWKIGGDFKGEIGELLTPEGYRGGIQHEAVPGARG